MDYKKVFTFAGAFIAYLIGSGFATGQEVLQYFTSYGYWGIAGVLVTLLLLMYVGYSFITVGQREQFERGSDIYKYYCGNILGNFYDYFSIVFIYLSFIVMVAGAGATLNQHYGQPVVVGGTIMTIIVTLVVLMGLNKIVDIIGKIGPIIVFMSIAVGAITLFMNFGHIGEASRSIPDMNIMQASSNWFMAATSYVGFCMLWLASFLASMGVTADSKKQAGMGAIIGATLFSIAVGVVAMGLLSVIELVGKSEIPMLIMSGNISPFLATVFSIIVYCGIFTTAVPLLWSASSRFTEDKSKNFKILTIVLAVVGLIVGVKLPFSKLVNVVYVLNGYVGAALLVIMIVKDIKKIVTKTASEEEAA
jgi:uncharacterized membrane protein YkvI